MIVAVRRKKDAHCRDHTPPKTRPPPSRARGAVVKPWGFRPCVRRQKRRSRAGARLRGYSTRVRLLLGAVACVELADATTCVDAPPQIGRAHGRNPVTNTPLVCLIILSQNKHYTS